MNCTTLDAQAACLDLSNNSAPTVMGSTFVGGTKATINVPITGLSGFTGCSSIGQTLRRDHELSPNAAFSGAVAATLSMDDSLNQSGTFIAAGGLLVPAGHTLTLGTSVVLKFPVFSNQLICDGDLITTSGMGAPAVLSSLDDDAYGGDSNLNGSATSGAPGQWTGLVMYPNSDGSTLRSLLVRCAGFGGNGGIRLSGCNATLSDVAVEMCGGPCLDLSNTSAPSVVDCRFDGGTHAATNVPMPSLAGFKRCTAHGNSLANAPRVTSSSVNSGETVVVSAINTFNGSGAVHIAGQMFVYAGGSLELGPGVVLKFEGLNPCLVFGNAILHGSGHDPVVLTSIHDDAFGGDSNGNGNATLPAPAQWQSLQLQAGSTGSLEHVRLRYGGGGGAALAGYSAAVTYKSVRVDSAADSGFLIAASGGSTLDNLVAWNCNGDGIRFDGPAALQHATVSGCTGVGIRSGPNPGPGVGTAVNCISFGNAQGDYANFGSNAVNFSNGAALGGGVGNLNSNPLFVDAANGDLRLQATSPCVDSGWFATAFSVIFDHDEGSRVSDGLLAGTALADLGAYELAAYRLVIAGKVWSHGGIDYRIDGPAGNVILGVSFVNIPQSLLPAGILAIGPVSSVVVLDVLPANTTRTITFGDLSSLEGLGFGLQAFGIPQSQPGVGTLSNVYRGVIDQ